MAEKAMYLDLDGLECYDERIKEYIRQQRVPIINDGIDNTVIITPSDEGTKIKVNIDNSTIVTNRQGQLSASLTQYVGEDSITVSELDPIINERTISLTIKNGDNILSQNGNGLTATIKIKALTAEEINTLDDSVNIKEAYKIVGNSDIANSDIIKIYKDSSLLSVKTLHAERNKKPTYNPANKTWTDIDTQTDDNLALCFAYQLAEGIDIECIAIKEFIHELHYSNGISLNDQTKTVVGIIDPVSEAFLTVGEDGFKISGIQNAIDGVIDEELTIQEISELINF